jgi:hypothetical protein
MDFLFSYDLDIGMSYMKGTFTGNAETRGELKELVKLRRAVIRQLLDLNYATRQAVSRVS